MHILILRKDSRNRIKRHRTNSNNLELPSSCGEVKAMVIVSSESAVALWALPLPRFIPRTQAIPTEHVKAFR